VPTTGRRCRCRSCPQVLDVGATEIWEARNAAGTPHNFHPHGVSFRLPDYAGSPPPAQLSGWKDTLYIPPGETVQLVVRSPDHADPETPYMFHCHILQHEDRGMMGQFVVEPAPVSPTNRPAHPSQEGTTRK
jgi:FtsP/CotA-like multicopper oxidase with cupredoxin domain